MSLRLNLDLARGGSTTSRAPGFAGDPRRHRDQLGGKRGDGRERHGPYFGSPEQRDAALTNTVVDSQRNPAQLAALIQGVPARMRSPSSPERSSMRAVERCPNASTSTGTATFRRVFR
jgi:hypothetical protein